VNRYYNDEKVLADVANAIEDALAKHRLASFTVPTFIDLLIGVKLEAECMSGSLCAEPPVGGDKVLPDP
jgi:hypothetical protein